MIGGAKGIGIGLDFGIGNQLRPRNGKPYIEQAVLDSLCGVWIADQNTNESSTRNTIKNKLKDRGGDFKILNAAYKDNSGYGLYKEDFTKMNLYSNVIASYNKLYTNSDFNTSWIAYDNSTVSKNAMKISIKGIPENGFLYYWYVTVDKKYSVIMSNNGTYELPASDSFVGLGDIGFNIGNPELDWTNIVIEQIPDYQGSFVTDGVDDLIVSEKSVSDMLGGSNEITVISMIHQISKIDWIITNIIRKDEYNYIRNRVIENNKTGIYGYTNVNNNGSLINNILGDKEDYNIEYTKTDVYDGNFSVVGVLKEDNSIVANSSVAFYWTVIANKVLTSDQINQVIEYFNLDKYVKPDVLYNVKKQGITNDNHASFGDKLIDYSGNGRDMQLYNIGWKGESGIGKYETDFLDSNIWNYKDNSIVTSDKIVCDKAPTHIMLLYYNVKDGNKYDVPSFSVLKQGDDSEYYYIDEQGMRRVFKLLDGINILPASHNTLFTGTEETCGFGNPGIGNSVTITQIPSHVGSLVLDGVNDYGKVDNMPIYKDYTVVVDREILRTNKSGCSISKNNPGAFLMELGAATASSNGMASYSFGLNKTLIVNNKRQFSYQSKYLYNGEGINVGTEKDTKDMWLGTVRDLDNRFSNLAFYSAMLFPYSLSKFLIERQLKRHKLGSFYEGMILFRPEISSNVPYESIEFYYETRSGTKEKLLPGDYFTLQGESAIAAYIRPYGADEPRSITVNEETYNLRSYGDGTYHAQIFPTKFPQKIDITIDEYIRFEDIVQPYPAFFEFIDKNGNLFSWGGKARIGSTITMTKGISSSNLLPDMYDITALELNGVPLSTLELTVSEFMGFSCIPVWKLDNNEPKCILSPEKLNMPNSAYEALGYIPDISGNGNHGYIYNSAYNETSGMNEDGSFKLDGVDDYIKLDTLSVGGQQVLMKCKWSKATRLLYDQRSQLESDFAILTTAKDEGVDNDRIAYNARNRNGYSYIDGIWNQYVETYTLQDVIHNITITNDEYTDSQSPVIGKGTYSGNYAGMSLYTFMLFDEISTNDEISHLNTIVGVEPKIEFPPYYYDNHGRSNLDENKVTLDNLGTGGVHPLVAQNVAFEGMSGYGGFPVVFGSNKTWQSTIGEHSYEYTYNENIAHVTRMLLKNSMFFSYKAYAIAADVPSFKIKISGINKVNIRLEYQYFDSAESTTKSIMIITEDGEYTIPKSFANNNMIDGDWIGLRFNYKEGTTGEIDCDITLEILPEYENAIVLDGVNDTLRNTTIPAFTDFTCIVKREAIGEQTANSIFALKGATLSTGGKNNAFLYDYKSAGANNVYSFGQANGGDTNSPISYLTKTQCDDRTITSGDGTDSKGLMIGKWDTWYKGAFYKMLLWNKTLDNLSINMIKNLIEEDNVIDINNPIFKK